jgi:isocitrate/isopropylmalate dehydrogenase
MSQPAKTYRIASIPGDGIGVEVVAAAIEVAHKLTKSLKTFSLEFEELPWGTEFYKKTGSYMPEDGLQTLKQYDAIFFGSVGMPGNDLSLRPYETDVLITAITNTHGQTSQIISLCGVFYSQCVVLCSNTQT